MGLCAWFQINLTLLGFIPPASAGQQARDPRFQACLGRGGAVEGWDGRLAPTTSCLAGWAVAAVMLVQRSTQYVFSPCCRMEKSLLNQFVPGRLCNEKDL